MTTSYCINTNKRQYKLRNSKIIARIVRGICPKIPRAPETFLLTSPQNTT
jgi:hypothetical protein